MHIHPVVASFEKFNYHLYHLKNVFIHHEKMVNVIKVMDIFLINNIDTNKMFGIHLILINLKLLLINY